jgi:hypothetical protein
VGEGVACRPGGIFALLRLLEDEETSTALQFDLLERGMSLDRLGYDVSWWDLICVLRWLPQDAAVFRLRHPDTWWRTIEVELAAKQFDALRAANWQRSGDPNAPRPEPILPPLPEPAENKPVEKPKMTSTEIRDELAKRRALHAQRTA